MGVLNVTPDSFSDGGRYIEINRAVKKFSELLEAGSDVIDVGGQSTRPGSEYIGYEEEINRLLPVIIELRKLYPKALISVDTFLSKVALKLIENGVNWINDVSGGREDPDILRIVADANCPYVINHSRGNSKTMDKYCQYKNVTKEVIDELLILTDKAICKGVRSSQIIWDPGLGFAKTNDQNIQIIKELDSFKMFDFPVLLGPSRKKFLGHILDESDPEKRLEGTLSVACKCVSSGISMIRVHDVYQVSRAMQVANYIF
tara:strand:- start:10524 stop:11303 length:780 start_codon:yes stop_codon:yes gene_type:complete